MIDTDYRAIHLVQTKKISLNQLRGMLAKMAANEIRTMPIALTNAGARAFKVGGPKFFIDFSPGKACRA